METLRSAQGDITEVSLECLTLLSFLHIVLLTHICFFVILIKPIRNDIEYE